MDDLILQQTEELGLISRAFKNLKKKVDFSKGDVEARMAALDKRWCQIEERHEQISRKATKEDRSKNYFKTSFMEDAEEQYLDEKAKFLNAIRALDPPPPPRNAADQEYDRSRRKLPPIGIPSFSGKYSEWNSFKDFFTALVASDTCLSDVERLHYLKSNLTGDAANLIKNIPVTDDNYDRAWTKLTTYFDNKRALIYSCLDALFQLDSMKSESYQALKQLKDGTSEAIETLQVLGRPVDKMDDFIVHVTVRRFDSRTRRDWELSLGDSTTPVT